MTLTVYNTLNRREEPFTTLEPGKVRMYYCGITVYDYCHLGHARACIIWDVVRRYLQWRGYQVRFVQNFTDVDDKILNRARQEGSTMEAVSERFIKAYFEDMARLNIAEADEYPRATLAMDGIKRLIYELEQKGFAYPSDGDVYYTVRNFADYGKLSGRKLEDMRVGASGRVEVEDGEVARKRDPFDFALWKGAKEGEPAWQSDWGKGRPGWHIECSAMVRDRLGDTIDIHAGGADLIFPHHENEIAQSEAATGKPLANYWLHNGMVTVGGEKMSKSLGNFITIRELLDRPADPMAIRLFVLMAQYRKPLDFTDEAIASATNGWHTLKEGLLFGYQFGEQLGWSNLPAHPAPAPIVKVAETLATPPKNYWHQALASVLEPFAKFPQHLREVVSEYKGLVALTLLLALAILPLKIADEVLKAIRDIPTLPILFQITGIAVTARYLLLAKGRQELREKLQAIRAELASDRPATAKLLPATPAAALPDYAARFQAAIDSDFNFSGGLAVLFEIAKELRKEGNILIHSGKTETAPEVLYQQWQTLVSLASVLGLKVDPEEAKTPAPASGLSNAEIEALIAQRQEARKAKNFAEGDRIRNELQAQGITLIDSPEGTRWHRSSC